MRGLADFQRMKRGRLRNPSSVSFADTFSRKGRRATRYSAAISTCLARSLKLISWR
jgi:hypothetical protein